MGTQLSDRCRSSLYRAVFSHADEDSIVFVFAGTREDARERAASALAAIHTIPVRNVQLADLASFREMVDIGVSEDEDLRIFEMAWKGADVSAWAEHPLFLLTTLACSASGPSCTAISRANWPSAQLKKRGTDLLPTD